MAIVASIAKSVISGFFGSGLGTIADSVVKAKKHRLDAALAKMETAAEQEKVQLNAEISRLELELVDIEGRRSFVKSLLESWWFKGPVAAIVISTAIWYCSIIFRTQYGYASITPLDVQIKDIAEWIIYIMLGGGVAGGVSGQFRNR